MSLPEAVSRRRHLFSHRLSAFALAFLILVAGASVEAFAQGRDLPSRGVVRLVGESEIAGEDVAFDPASSAGLFVGVRAFFDPDGSASSTITEVPFAADDAVDLAHMFALEIGLIQPDRVTIAISSEPQKEESRARLDRLVRAGARRTTATLSALLSEVARSASLAREEGLLVVAFASHGFSAEGESSLLAQDSWMGNLDKTAITLSELRGPIETSRAHRRLVLLDACRERVAQGRSVGGDGAVSRSLAETLGGAKGMVIVMSTVAGGFSYDDLQRQNGVFTGAILDGLRGAAAADDRGFITLENVSHYASSAVNEWVRANRPEHKEVSNGISVWYESLSAFEMPLVVSGPAVAVAPVPAAAAPSATRSVWLRRSDGGLYSREAPKAEARRSVIFFPLRVQDGDPDRSWAARGVNLALRPTLEQHPFILCSVPSDYSMFGSALQTLSHMDTSWARDPELASYPQVRLRQIAREVHDDFFATGTIGHDGAEFTLNLELHSVESGELVATRTERAARVLDLVDPVARFLADQIVGPIEVPGFEWRTSVDLLTDSEEALRLLTAAMEKSAITGDKKAALSLLEQAIELDDTFAVAHFFAAAHYGLILDIENLRKSTQNLLDLLYRFPEQKQYGVQGFYYLAHGDPLSALQIFEMWMRLYEDDIEALFSFASAAALMDRLDDAIWAHEKILEIEPSLTSLLLGMGQMHLENGDLARAASTVQQYIDRDPRDVRGYMVLGDIYSRANEFQAADEAYARAQLLSPGKIDAQLARIELLKRQDRWDEVRRRGAALKRSRSDEGDLARIDATLQDPAIYAGVYWDDDQETVYYAVVRSEQGLVMELPGKFQLKLLTADSPDHFRVEAGLDFEVVFERGGDEEIVATRLESPSWTERRERHRPSPDLDPAPVVQTVMGAHGMDALLGLDGVRLVGRVEIPELGKTGTAEHVFDAGRSRLELDFGDEKIVWLSVAGQAFGQWLGEAELQPLEGEAREQVLLRHPRVSFGDWSAEYDNVSLLRVDAKHDDAACSVLRVMPSAGPGSTKLVDSDSGLVTGERRLDHVPGSGLVGVNVEYGRFEDVAGMRLPFEQTFHYDNQIGEVKISFESFEVKRIEVAMP